MSTPEQDDKRREYEAMCQPHRAQPSRRGSGRLLNKPVIEMEVDTFEAFEAYRGGIAGFDDNGKPKTSRRVAFSILMKTLEAKDDDETTYHDMIHGKRDD